VAECNLLRRFTGSCASEISMKKFELFERNSVNQFKFQFMICFVFLGHQAELPEYNVAFHVLVSVSYMLRMS